MSVGQAAGGGTMGKGQFALERIISSTVDPLGLELVEMRLSRAGGRQLLRVDIDRAGPKGVNIDDCKRVSDALSEALESADPIQASYVLEVSSPGADRPIRNADDFRRHIGRRVVIEARDAAGSERTVVGTLTGSDDGQLTVESDDAGEVQFSMDQVVQAHQELDF